jgi:hypothetical protein
MRCAKDGRHFTVLFKRDIRSRKFMVERIAASSPDGGTGDLAEFIQHNADVYDFTGFYCPCCGFVPEAVEGSFVHCGKCNELVCMGLGYEKLDNAHNVVRCFVCYPQCGGVGSLVGVIQEYGVARSVSTERAPIAKLPSEPPPLKLGKT